jgi:formylglycine-generating enzyme required for sulfatase activity
MGCRPADLWLRWWTGDKTIAAFTRCQFRPWTKLDAERFKKPMPGNFVACQREETALRFHEPNLGLREKPVLAEPKAFVVVSTGTPMVWVAPGKFQHPGIKDPKQAVEVTISRGFWIGRYEMTQGEWMTLLPSNPSRVFGSPFLPVDGVSYEDVGKFCALLNRQEARAKRVPPGYVYRVPTEAEWEYACRAGKNEDFSVDPPGIWSAETAGRRPHEVGAGQANPWGLCDMHGNVSEWCLDAWRDEPETPVWRVTDPLVAPKSTSDLLVLRGGAWWQGRDGCSCRAREQSRSVSGGHRGFRLVLGPVVR